MSTTQHGLSAIDSVVVIGHLFLFLCVDDSFACAAEWGGEEENDKFKLGKHP